MPGVATVTVPLSMAVLMAAMAASKPSVVQVRVSSSMYCRGAGGLKDLVVDGHAVGGRAQGYM